VCTCVFLLHQESFDIILVNNTLFYDGGVTVVVLLVAKTSSREQGLDFDLVGTSPKIVVCETPEATCTMCQSGSSPTGCISI
jgi:hypothetical protein